MNYFSIRIFALTLCSFLFSSFLRAQSISGYRVSKVFHIASSGGWDYIACGPANNRLYVSHATQVNILDAATGDSIGVIPNTTGVHGIAFVTSLGKGYTSNGRLNNITVFDLVSNQVLGQITAGTNPDAIMYDEYSKWIITCNGRSHDLSIIDPFTENLVGTIPVDGKPETAVSNGKGMIYVNIEDKSEVVGIDIKSMKITNSWSLAPSQGPTGLAIDLKNNRLFSGCDKTLVIVDISSGKIQRVAIGDGCDGVAFDPALGYVFASCGEGKLSVVHESKTDEYELLENIPTKKSARTIALNTDTHTIYLPSGDFGPVTTPGSRPPVIPGTFQILVLKQE